MRILRVISRAGRPCHSFKLGTKRRYLKPPGDPLSHCAPRVARTPQGCRAHVACARMLARLLIPKLSEMTRRVRPTKADKAKAQRDCAESGLLSRAERDDSAGLRADAPARQNH